VLNCHPFQHGKWVLAHNGDIQDFAKHRPELVQRVAGPCDAGGNLAAIRDEKTAKSVHGRAR
jgi:hypothetical protein